MMQNNLFSLLSPVINALNSLYRSIFGSQERNMVCKSENFLYGRLAIQKGFITLSIE